MIKTITNLEETLHEVVLAGEEFFTMMDFKIKSTAKAAKPEEQGHYSKVVTGQREKLSEILAELNTKESLNTTLLNRLVTVERRIK